MTNIPVARNAHPSDAWVSEISYNGVRFPPALHSTADFSPVYDDSGRIMKYMKVVLNVEAYMFSGVLEAPVSNTLPYHAPLYVTDTSTTTDNTMKSVRRLLNEPCQQLTFTYQGGGNLTLNGPTSPRDVNNGPKPKVVKWQPLTDKMAKVSWTCEAAFCPCDPDTGTSGKLSDIAQFPFTVSNDIGEDGLTVRNITGCYERRLTRVPTKTTSNPPTGTGKAGISEPFDMLEIERDILSRFPMVLKFKRRTSFELSNDRKTVNFTIIDSEIGGADAYGIGCANEDVTLSTSGGLNEGKGGFANWNTSLRGNITLMAGYPKSFALAEILRLFKRYKGLSGKGFTVPVGTKTSDSEGNPTRTGSLEASRSLLKTVSFSDKIFSNEIGFELEWMNVVSLNYLLDATGIFQPVEPTALYRTQNWGKWRTSVEKIAGVGSAELGFNEQDDIIVSLCLPLRQGSAGDRDPKDPKPTRDEKKNKVEQFKEEGSTNSKDPKHLSNYLSFRSQFAIEAHHPTLRHTPLQGVNYLNTQEKALSNYRLTSDMQWPGVTSTSDSNGDPTTPLPNMFHSLGHPVYTLIFRGMASRAGYPVPNFHVESYGGQPVYPIGTDDIRPRRLGNGLDIETGDVYAIHGLMWEKRYALLAPPKNSIITSDGLKSLQT